MTRESASDHRTTDHEGSAGEPDHAAHANVFRSLFVSLVEAARTRLDLATVEAEIFLLRTIQMLLWALAAVACALLALAFGVVAIVAALWDTHRMLGVLSGAGLFVVLALVFGYIASRSLRGRPQMLDGTLKQLETDTLRASGTEKVAP
jgi:uncharacterized membrane protein YqjE